MSKFKSYDEIVKSLTTKKEDENPSQETIDFNKKKLANKLTGKVLDAQTSLQNAEANFAAVVGGQDKSATIDTVLVALVSAQNTLQMYTDAVQQLFGKDYNPLVEQKA